MNPNASSSIPSDEGRDELEALAKDGELSPRSLYLTVTQVLYRSEAVNTKVLTAIQGVEHDIGEIKTKIAVLEERSKKWADG